MNQRTTHSHRVLCLTQKLSLVVVLRVFPASPCRGRGALGGARRRVGRLLHAGVQEDGAARTTHHIRLVVPHTQWRRRLLARHGVQVRFALHGILYRLFIPPSVAVLLTVFM